MQENLFSSGSHPTPKSIIYLITILAAISLLSPITTFFLHYFFNLPGPQDLLPLSRAYLQEGFIFQLITYPFIQFLGVEVSLTSLLGILLRLGALWLVSIEITHRFGEKRFLWLFFSASLFSGLIAAGLLLLIPSAALLFGTTPALFALLTIWMMSMKEEILVSHPFIQIKGKTIICLILGITLFVNLSSGQFLAFAANTVAILYGLFFAFWQCQLPLPFSLPKRKKKKKKQHTSADIIDITSATDDPDDIFMDEMLDKIAKVGREGLSEKELARMDAIVKRRRHSEKK